VSQASTRFIIRMSMSRELTRSGDQTVHNARGTPLTAGIALNHHHGRPIRGLVNYSA